MLKLLLFVWNGFFLVLCFATDVSHLARSHGSIKAIESIVHQSLAKLWRHRAPAIARAVSEESRRLDLDPMLLLAMMETESKFRPDIRGRHGEIGLMQIKPSTARWISGKYGLATMSIARTRQALYDPVTNIRYASAYLAYLRESVGPSHYVSAYNLGAARLRRSLRKNHVPRDYRARVFSNHRRIQRMAPPLRT